MLINSPAVTVNWTCCNASQVCDPLKCECQLVSRALDVANQNWNEQKNRMPACTGLFFLISQSAILVLKWLATLAILRKIGASVV